MVSWLLLPLLLGFEAGLFAILAYADKYVTDAAVKKFGIRVEANPRMRDMYEKNDFKLSFRGTVGILSVYIGLAMLSLKLDFSYQFQFWAVVLGLILLAFPLGNLIISAWRYRKLRTTGLGPESS